MSKAEVAPLVWHNVFSFIEIHVWSCQAHFKLCFTIFT